jgi:acyl-CoA synthetase (NDP forming)
MSEAILTPLAERLRKQQQFNLSEPDGKRVLSAFGITVPRSVTVRDLTDVETALDTLTPPLAVKAVAPALVHKSDAGGVKLGLRTKEDVSHAIEEIRRTTAERNVSPDAYLIEEMAPAGHEVVIGGLDDPQFGPVIMVGLGGVFVEIFADVSFRVCPIGERDARAMLSELKGAPILRGARGGIVASEDALIDAMLRVGGKDGLLMQHRADIAALDINPLIVSGDGAVAADAHIVILETAADPIDESEPLQEPAAICDHFRPLFQPRNIAVIGMSATRHNRCNTFIDQLLTYGFDREKLYPIHPSATEVDGLKTYPSLAEAPETVDYAYVSIRADAIPSLLSEAKGHVRVAHVIASGYAEAGEHALQDQLTAAAREAGIRVLGPNCNGGYSPRGHLTFCYDGHPDEGSVGVLLQSGGLGVDTIRRGNHRGLRFSGVMTIGNCADVTPNDLLEFYLADPDTRVVGMYLEGVPDGRRMMRLLRERRNGKPVVILKGGRTEFGRAAAMSHTGTLAGDERLWDAVSQQAGVILADTLDDFLDKLLALQCLEPRKGTVTEQAVLVGNGGGTSVLGVDMFARAGLRVAPFQDATVAKIKALDLAPGATYANPVDLPRPVLVGNAGRDAEQILDLILENDSPHAVVLHINMAVVVSQIDPGDTPLMNLLDAAERVRQRNPGTAHFVLVLRSDGNLEYEKAKADYRAIALERGIPTYDEIPAAAAGLAAVAHHERYLADNSS